MPPGEGGVQYEHLPIYMEQRVAVYTCSATSKCGNVVTCVSVCVCLRVRACMCVCGSVGRQVQGWKDRWDHRGATDPVEKGLGEG